MSPDSLFHLHPLTHSRSGCASSDLSNAGKEWPRIRRSSSWILLPVELVLRQQDRDAGMLRVVGLHVGRISGVCLVEVGLTIS